MECAARVGAGAAAGTRHVSVSSVYVYQEARKEGRYITASKKINNEAFKRVCMCVLVYDVIAASAHGVCVWLLERCSGSSSVVRLYECRRTRAMGAAWRAT